MEKYWSSSKKKPYIQNAFIDLIKNSIRGLDVVLPESLHLKLHNFITKETRDYHRIGIETLGETPIFDGVWFELRTRCSGRCPFCAASIQNETRKDETIEFESYKKVIDQLSKMKFAGTIAWHVNSEPLLVRNIHEFVAYARKNCPNAWLQILSNGRSLNNINGQNLIDNGINEISLNIYDDDFNKSTPKNICKFEKEVLETNFDPKQIKSGFREIGIKGKFIKFNKFRRKLNITMSNRAGSSPNKKTNKKLPSLGFCQYPFTQLNITANGKVSHCCADLQFALPMGNINNQSIKEIWHGKPFNRIRNKLLQNKRSELPMCSKCDFYGIKKVPNNPIRKVLYKSLMTE